MLTIDLPLSVFDMHPFHLRLASSYRLFWICSCLLFYTTSLSAQKNAIVQVHADKVSGYGVACGGPQNLPDRIVTALHVVAGKKTILVNWQGKTSTATIEKIYKPSDLALLKLQTPLGIPTLTLYSGDPPWDTNVNFWEIPLNTTTVTPKTTSLEERTSLARISPRVANNPTGLTKSLCSDGGQYYPGMNTEVINFKEPNIRKAHSGSPLTYDGKILGMVDGGASLIDGKACVWAIPATDFTKLFTQGTAPSTTLPSCGGTTGSAYMYSGTRSDNPLLSPEEAQQAAEFEQPLGFTTGDGTSLTLFHDYRLTYDEVWETLFPEMQSDLTEILEGEQDISLDDMFGSTIDIYTEDVTGISVMVPTQCTLSASSDQSQTFIYTNSPGGLVTMSVFISVNNSMEEGMEAMEGFKAAMAEFGHEMIAAPEDITDFRDDENEPYYSEYVENNLRDDQGNITGEFFADLICNNGDLLAITVSINDYDALDAQPEERMFLYLMETCAMLSDFMLY